MLLLRQENFLGHLNTVFLPEGRSHALTLARVTRSRRKRVPGVRAPFDLIFRGPPGDVLAKGWYRLRTENGRLFHLYLEPAYTRSPKRQNYKVRIG